MIYLDNAATTFPKPEAVYLEMDKANRELAVNAGRGSYKLARMASDLITDTKNQIKRMVQLDAGVSVVFSPSITVALNQIIYGLNLRDRAVVYVSPYEHNAVARTVHNLSLQKNIIVKELPIEDGTLEIDLDRIKYEFSKDKPAVILCTHISNVTGYILPVKQIFSEGRKYGSINVLDTAQSLGLLPIDAKELNVDFIAFAGHKSLYGPLGIGGFINVTGNSLEEFITGGTGSDSLNLEMPRDNEVKYEAASTNIVAVAGLNAAIKTLDSETVLQEEKGLTEYLSSELRKIPGIRVWGGEDPTKYIGIVSFAVEGMISEDVGMILDEDFDIAVRTGYHCAPYIHKYLKDEETLGTVRVGIGRFTCKEDIDKLLEALKEIRD